MVLTASHQTTGRQALQHTTDAKARDTARRPLGVWLGREKILRTPTRAQGSRKRDGASGLTLSSLERSSGRRVAFCSLRTNRSAAQTQALTMRRTQARCTCKFALHNLGAALREVKEWALCPPGNMSCCRLPPPLLSLRNAAHAHARSGQQGGSGQEPPSACHPAHGLVVGNLQRSYSCRSR